jgi:hypothetical protein
LQDSEALQQKEAESPPKEGFFSISIEGIPDWANSKATVIPEIPPPMIRTSFFSNCMLLCYGYNLLILMEERIEYFKAEV